MTPTEVEQALRDLAVAIVAVQRVNGMHDNKLALEAWPRVVTLSRREMSWDCYRDPDSPDYAYSREDET